MFEKLGAVRLDTDALAHEALRKDQGPYRKLLSVFGEGILLRNGQVNRAELAERVFADATQLKRLNRIVHPPLNATTFTQEQPLLTAATSGRMLIRPFLRRSRED